MSDTAAPQFKSAHRPRIATMRSLGPVASVVPLALDAEPLRARQLKVSSPDTFKGRKGFDSDFLGTFAVPFPLPGAQLKTDVTKVPGQRNGRLDYQHFSIVMSASRRMAMFVAVNIEGSRPVDVDRDNDPWYLDGRIPVDAQLGEDLYRGNRLDRGHLVRRADPNWGSKKDAERANADTFHFTNCAPQMDIVNQQTWLGLENYILENAKLWKARCSVFTGPVFSKNDMQYRDALIPLAFWKVVAFLGEDGKPSATAYLVTQDKELSALSAAFGAYKTYQRSVVSIEKMTGLSFGKLAQFDGYSNDEAALGGNSEISTALTSLADIRV